MYWSSGALDATITAMEEVWRRPARPVRCHVDAILLPLRVPFQRNECFRVEIAHIGIIEVVDILPRISKFVGPFLREALRRNPHARLRHKEPRPHRRPQATRTGFAMARNGLLRGKLPEKSFYLSAIEFKLEEQELGHRGIEKR